MKGVRAFIILSEFLLMIALICTWTCFGYNAVRNENDFDTQQELLAMGLASSFAFILIIFPLFMADQVVNLYKMFGLAIGYAGIVLLIAGCFIIHKIAEPYETMLKGDKFAYACGIIGIVFGIILFIGSAYVVGITYPDIDENQLFLREKLAKQRASNDEKKKVVSTQEEPKIVGGAREEPVKQDETPTIEVDTDCVEVKAESIEEGITFVSVTPCTTPVGAEPKKSRSLCRLSSFEKPKKMLQVV